MHSLTLAVETKTSTAGTLPIPSALGTNLWETTPFRTLRAEAELVFDDRVERRR